MNNDFRSQTTTLQTNFPLKGKGLINDRLRLDVSGLAADTEYVLSYDTTTGTFSWSTPDEVSGIDTLYTSNGSIPAATDRQVTLGADASVYFTNAGETDWVYYEPEEEFSVKTLKPDYYMEGSDISSEFQSTGDNIFIGVGSQSQIDADPEDPTVYFRNSRNAYMELEDDNVFFEITENATVNSENIQQVCEFGADPTQIYLSRRQLTDYSGGENTFLTYQLGDTENGFGFIKSVDDSTVYRAASSLGEGEVVLNDAGVEITHARYGASANSILLSATHDAVASIELNLTTDLDQPLMSRTDLVTAVETHRVYWDADGGIEITTVGNTATDDPTINIISRNTGGADTSLILYQQDTSATQDPSFAGLQVANGANTVSSAFYIYQDHITFDVTGTVATPAIMSLNSTVQGFLPPRMTTAERDLIAAPVAGLMIYNTTTNKLNVYTTVWEAVTSAA